jgi:hypothetical protein
MKDVMKALLNMDSSRNPLTIPSMGYKDRDLLFESLFQTFLETIDPELSTVDLDGQSTLNYIALPKGDPSRTLSR